MDVIPSLADLPTRLDGLIATDLETRDPGLTTMGPGWCFQNPDGYIIGYGVWTPNFSCYLPIGHTEGNVDPDKATSWYDEVVARSSNDKVFANGQYDMGWSRTKGIIRWNGVLRDVLLAAPLIDEHRYSYDLDRLSVDKLPGAPRKMNVELEEAAAKLGIRAKDVKANLHRLPPQIVGEYCIQDCRLTYMVDEVQEREIEDQKLRDVYELECDLTPMLIEMRARGVRVDLDEAERQNDPRTEPCDRYPHGSLAWQEIHLTKEIKDKTGCNIESCWNAGQLYEVLKVVGIEPPRTPKTDKPSIGKDWLLAQNDPTCTLINNLRKVNKIRTKFVVADVLGSSRNGRIYGSFNPLKSDDGGTISGRFSSSKPNLQQIPARDEILGPLTRGLYIPEEGCLWGSLDFSQQEPRAMAAMAFRTRIPSSYAWVERYRTKPETDFHDMASEFTGVVRKDAKSLGLGIAYSMGSGKLARKLGLPTEWKQMRNGKMLEVGGPEAMAMMAKFNGAAGFIKDLSRRCTAVAKTRGWITTPDGRRFHFPLKDGQHFKAHKALNSLIQGMAASEMKLAMRQMYREGFLPAVTVHDELGFTTFTCPEDARRPIEIMLTALPKPVPSLVDLEMGTSWGDSMSHKIKLPGLPVIYTET